MKSLKVRKHIPIHAPSFPDAWCGDPSKLSEADEDRVTKATENAIAELAGQLGLEIAKAGSAVEVTYNGRVDVGTTLATIEIEVTLKAAQAEQPMTQTFFVLYKVIGEVNGTSVFGPPINVTTDPQEALDWAKTKGQVYRTFTEHTKPNAKKWTARTWSEWYRIGYDAAMSGNNIKRRDCPILEGTRNEADWLAGWDQGDKDAEWMYKGEIAFEQGKTPASAPTTERACRFWTVGYRRKAVDAMLQRENGAMFLLL